MERQRNASIEGIGSIYGGKLDSAAINGIGKIKGDAELGSFTINGIGKATGKLIAENINNNGIGRLKKEVNAKKIINSGVLKISHSINAEELISNGYIFIKEAAYVDNFKAVFIKSSYADQILGDVVDIKLETDSGRNNTIGPIWVFEIFIQKKLKVNKFSCNLIECTRLNADNLQVHTVRAQDIVLGPNCIVDYLEYSNSFTAHESCIVKKAVKV